MPVTTERPRRSAQRGATVAIVGGALLLLSLPAWLTLLPKGVSVGGHGVRAAWSKCYGVPAGPWANQSLLMPGGNQCFMVGWNANCYQLEVW